MRFLKTRKNKKFEYRPRYYESDKQGSPFHPDRKFDQFRVTTVGNHGFKGKIINAWNDLKTGSDKRTTKTILIISAILILIFLFIIEFDLSIFKQAL